MRIPLLRGRDIAPSDAQSSAPVVVISEAFARRYYRSSDAIGRHLSDGQIIGVVADVQQHSGIVRGDGPLSIEPTLYVPAAQLKPPYLRVVHTWFSPKWVVRASGTNRGLAAQMQNAMASVDPQIPIASFQSIDDLRWRTTRAERFRAILFAVLAGLALLLAALGLYGLISQNITRRTRELGVRLALGATPRQVILSVMNSGVWLASAGAAAGIAISIPAVRLLKTLVWGVRTLDPATFAVCTAMLLLAALAATLAPATRILRLDPAETLRDE